MADAASGHDVPESDAGVEVVAAPPPELPEVFRTEARVRLQEQARRFALDEVKPVADEYDPHKREMPRSLIEAMGRLGFFGIMVGEEHGGLGAGVFEYTMIAEELARAWMSVASIIARAQGLGTDVGDATRRSELLRASARGEWIGAAGFSEPDAGSDLANVSTRAELDGDEYVVTGEKRWIGNAKAADFIQLLCRAADPEPGEKRSAGLLTLIVEKERGTFPAGLTGTTIDKIGYHGFLTWNLLFDGVRVPAANVAGGSGDGAEPGGTAAFRDTQRWLNIARVHTAARAVGLARAAVEDSTLYLQEREQFGHPIGDFQALRFMLASMAARVETARAFYQQVADRLDRGEPCERESAMAKLVATEMAVDVTSDAMQLHGGNGYTTERQVERYWRDARLTTIFEGTSQIQQKIIADSLLPRSPLG
ncbi:acyl-CoA dehydrogenase family protein [Jatrophihabitans endophyticus]|uniref:acyl-CoA dehydrogenase family protein n=1 Tax=Jatrophihabitans endophyticus TaxID=1206085 RepID=UPI0019E440C2|nr:acyl-CoA dehydrogenase family protein [Jatrophihabitans endophyticus]MBE7187351.1 acyl-CoA dehydrogenase family protein [Jatrophihabitans endophyticus]